MKGKSWFVLSIAVAMTVMFLAGVACAQDKMATPAQAKELLKKVVAYAKEAGCDKAFAEINKGTMFKIYKNAYPTAGESSGITLANAKYPFLVGQNHIDLKDADGKPFIKNAVEKCKTGCAPMEYRWLDNVTKKIETRTLIGESTDCGPKGKVNFTITYEGKL